MAKTKVVEVTGKGPFPIDMLRYDRLTPLTESDSAFIIKTFWGGPQAATTVHVVGERLTKDRWESFGWHAKEVKL